VEAPAQVVVGIETDRGLLVGALVAVGYQVIAVNPLAASRYRERHAIARAKSDRGDARMLADLVRTDGAAPCGPAARPPCCRRRRSWVAGTRSPCSAWPPARS
jgi:hypothetical protein